MHCAAALAATPAGALRVRRRAARPRAACCIVSRATGASARQLHLAETAAEDETPRRSRGLASFSVAALLAATLVSGDHTASAAVDAKCNKECLKECAVIAPGSPQYCADNCVDACDSDAKGQYVEE